ncbi:hypothetical protein ACFL3S_03470 [Gemmatimonadota bacterium]
MMSRWKRVVLKGLAALKAPGAWVLLRVRRTPQPGVTPPSEVRATGPESAMDPTEVRAERTVKIPPLAFDSVKVCPTHWVLPGRLLFPRGANKESIPLFGEAASGEVSIGRDSPGVNWGIRIKDPTNTVSIHQATIRFLGESERFVLVNKAGEESAPTTLNGTRLKMDEEAPLVDGDRLGMGVLEATFVRTYDLP